MDDAFPEVRSVATGLLYEEDVMLKHRCLWDPEFEECPERLQAVINRCVLTGALVRVCNAGKKCVSSTRFAERMPIDCFFFLFKFCPIVCRYFKFASIISCYLRCCW